MKVVKEYPPNINKIIQSFPIVAQRKHEIVYAYGDILYNPGGWPIPDHLFAHEQTHQKQQGDRVEEWWDRYLMDTPFRLSQELEAYRNQYRFVKEHESRQVAREFLKKIAKDCSSKIYGGMCSFEFAKQAITL